MVATPHLRHPDNPPVLASPTMLSPPPRCSPLRGSRGMIRFRLLSIPANIPNTIDSLQFANPLHAQNIKQLPAPFYDSNNTLFGFPSADQRYDPVQSINTIGCIITTNKKDTTTATGNITSVDICTLRALVTLPQQEVVQRRLPLLREEVREIVICSV
eukprot:TRINITY_DN2823_c1_g1_i3.p2 TRINITY_DN2823_c1_g1~~TRINITY_DN2823_c1_g1_i3.p2  ORF type:complete len:158 (-),score=16.47 TRINITY_DN2823_c1_g1_i3:143-616(-)